MFSDRCKSEFRIERERKPEWSDAKLPRRNDEHYLANQIATHVPGGKPKLEFRPVRITHWQPQARTY